MFNNEVLKEHLATSSTIKSNALIIAEWNLNLRENIYTIGNYRYRPYEQEFVTLADRSIYSTLNNSFDANDEGYFYTDATNADAVIDGGFKDDGTPTAFKTVKQKEKSLYSLEDCFGKFRPRSGINKLRYFENKYLHHSNQFMDKRPRYYFADAGDAFKYWTSYRTEALYKYVYENETVKYGASPTFVDGQSTKSGILMSVAEERGISRANQDVTSRYYIDDVAPFIVYKNSVPANRIVIKMQTNIGTVDLGPFSDNTSTFDDPFYGQDKATTPVIWKVQYLKDNNWIDAVSFNESSTRSDGSPIIGADGYVELSYGLIIPEQYRSIFYKVGEYYSIHSLPEIATEGEAYLIKSSLNDVGTYHIWFNGQYETFVPVYDWYLTEVDVTNSAALATELVETETYANEISNTDEYREFQYIDGIRIVVETMNVPDCTFDLIELSARLTANITDKTIDYTISKIASDLGTSGMPVGELLAGIGTINIFDYDLAFSTSNPNSIIKDFLLQNTQIKFFEVIVDNENTRHVVPIKTMYIEEFPEVDLQARTVALSLRDLFFLFESTTAPEILIPNAPLSYAISLLLDNAGFSNYIFKYTEDEAEPVISFFFVQPDISIAEVLNQLAVSTQTAMFFDEENNFVTMSKNYIMPTVEERATDLVLYGSIDFAKDGAYQNKTTNSNIANIIDLSSQENRIYNAGTINYKTRYIKRTYGNTAQSKYTGSGKTWIYQPALLWEVAPDANLYPINEEVENQSGALLGAIPLNSDLSGLVPSVENHQLINNVIDFGEAVVNFLTKYSGYFYANGEIIKYDAVEFSVSGEEENVWINNSKEFQKYFARLAFGGKIYPTGLVRIYAEPNYEVIDGITRMKNGAVAKHGRGQFGTPVVAHSAGLNEYWSSNDNVRGCRMDTRYLFGNKNFNTGNLIILESFAFFDIDDEHQRFEIFDDEFFTAISIGDTVQIKYFDSNLIIPSNVVTFAKVERVDYVNKIIRLDQPITVLDYLVPGLLDESSIISDSILSEESLIASESNSSIEYFMYIITQTPVNEADYGAAGVSNTLAQRSVRTGVIKSFGSASDITENELNHQLTTQTGTVQSSALSFAGGRFFDGEFPIQHISYVYKELEDKYNHFGTRMRIIGSITSSNEEGATERQEATGAMEYYTVTQDEADKETTITGGSGGIAIGLNKDTNVGYYFEIIAVNGLAVEDSESNEDEFSDYAFSPNLVFYKVVRNTEPETNESNAVPIKLWSGVSNILVDSGDFVGQYRLSNEQNPSVYDLAIEYEDVSPFNTGERDEIIINKNQTKRFYLYVNNKLVAVVDDPEPLPSYNNVAIFVRGTSKCMFENVYALGGNYAFNENDGISAPVHNVFLNKEMSLKDSFQKYALSGIIQSTYLSGIGTNVGPKYSIYFEEFGTLMREAAYYKIRYDKAYPALYSKISPTFSDVKGYTVSGYFAGAYGAEFLVFNNTDTFLRLDAETGNYLRIQGIGFTDESDNELSVDEYFNEIADLSNPVIQNNMLVGSPIKNEQDYFDIKTSRINYGRKEFSLEADYIQSQDQAFDLMEWMINKVMKPRMSVGVNIFANPILQLGDIVQINYNNINNNQASILADARFVIYNIEYGRSIQGPRMTIYLSEVK